MNASWPQFKRARAGAGTYPSTGNTMSNQTTAPTPSIRIQRLTSTAQAGLLAATFLWAGNFIVGRALRGLIDPLELNFWRWSIALAVLLPITGVSLASQWPTLRRHLGLVAALGLAGIAVPHACIYTALQTTSPVNALLLLNLAPLLITLGSWTLFGIPVSRRQWLGIAVSLVGAAALIVRGSLAALLALELTPGDLWMLPAIAGAAAHALLLKRTPAGVTQAPLLCASVVAALAIMLPLLLWRGPLVVPTSAPILWSLGYVGVLASAVAFWLWNRGVVRLGPARAGPYLYLMPVYGSIFSVLLLGEGVQAFQCVGGALVVAGLWLTRP
jgi:drug/metabolite transporter (DMT)-like permease